MVSKLLAEIIKERKASAISYEEYLKKIAELAKNVNMGRKSDIPDGLKTNAQRALYNNLNQNEELAIKLDKKIKEDKPHNWKGNDAKELVVKKAMYEVLQDVNEVNRLFAIVKQQGATHFQLGDNNVEVLLKDIKNIHLSVYPPNGRIKMLHL